MSPRRPGALLLAFWLAGAAAATGAGVLAVRLVADQVGDPAVPVLSTRDVNTALSATPGPTQPVPSAAATRSASTRATPRPPTAPTAFSSRGGSIGVRCQGAVPELVYRTPAQGYTLDETSAEGGVLEVRFTNGRTRVRLGVSCSSGAPRLVENRVDASGGKG